MRAPPRHEAAPSTAAADDGCLLELTGRAEATHFWFQRLPQIRRSRSSPTSPPAAATCGCSTAAAAPATTWRCSAARPRVRLRPVAALGCRRRAGRDGHAVVRADITRIPFPSGTFDIATSFDVLQCVEDDTAAVREMARVVRPGGMVVLTLAALEMLRGDHAEVWHEVRRYTPAQRAAAGRAAGFEPSGSRSCLRRCFR